MSLSMMLTGVDMSHEQGIVPLAQVQVGEFDYSRCYLRLVGDTAGAHSSDFSNEFCLADQPYSLGNVGAVNGVALHEDCFSHGMASRDIFKLAVFRRVIPQVMMSIHDGQFGIEHRFLRRASQPCHVWWRDLSKSGSDIGLAHFSPSMVG
jgi:hypothetical protein